MRIDLDLAQRLQPFGARPVEIGNGGHQALGIGMLRVVENVGGRARFHHFAAIHHHHLVGHRGDDSEVVGNQQDRHAELRLQVLQQFQDLRLNGDVERGGRLVGDQKGRATDERHGDHRPLPHAAGKLERIHVEDAGRIVETGQPEHFLARLAALRSRHRRVDLQHFLDLVADRVDRRKRGHRFLKDHADAAAANGADLAAVLRQGQKIGRLSGGRIGKKRAAGNPGQIRLDPRYRAAESRLAGTRFTHKRGHLAGTQAHPEILDGMDRTAPHREGDVQSFDVKQFWTLDHTELFQLVYCW